MSTDGFDLVHTSMSDLNEYNVSVEDLFGKCRPANDFAQIGHAGEGSSAVVYKAKDTKNGNRIVALKYIKYRSQTFPQDIFREINSLRQLNHKNIVPLEDIAVSVATNSIFLILEYCPYCLDRYIMRHPQTIPMPQIKCIAQQLFAGLAYLHRNYVMHRDLSPGNVLISIDSIVKITDFGSSRKFSYPLKPMSPGIGTRWYRAPEILLEGEYYGPAVDMWSVGCIIAELFSKKPILMGRSDLNQINLISELLGSPNTAVWPGFKNCRATQKIELKDHPFSNLRKRLSKLDASSFDLLSKLILYDPKKRLTASECLENDWLQLAPVPAKSIDVTHLQ